MAREETGGFVGFIVICFFVFILAFFWCFFVNTCCGRDAARVFCHSCCPWVTRWWQRRRRRGRGNGYQTAPLGETFDMSDDEFADELYGEFAAYDGDEPDATAGSEVPAPHRAHIPLTTVTTHQSASGPAHADPEPRSSADAIDDGLLTPSRP